METVFFEKPAELRKHKAELERKLSISLTIVGRKVTYDGSAINEYVAGMILEAMAFGFSFNEAIALKDEEMLFRKVPLRGFTRRKNLKDVRARLIGKEGKTRRTVEDISGCTVLIGDNAVGLIGRAEAIDAATQGVINIIRGSKQANAYRYLERMNAGRKNLDEGLGLKEEKKE